MAISLLTQEIWDSYTPPQQEAYRNALFISRLSIDDPWKVPRVVKYKVEPIQLDDGSWWFDPS